MSEIDARLAALTPPQRAVLELKLKDRLARAGGGATPIGRRPDPSTCELSFAQERLWFVERLQPTGGANHIGGALRVRGHLDRSAVERSLSAIIERHEVLREQLFEVEGRPAARLAELGPITVPVLRVTDADPAARLESARRLAQEEVARPFVLSSGPLLRASLVELSDTDHVLVLVMHHIAADGWSLSIVGRELGAFYEAFANERSPSVPPLPIQYPDFAAWQRASASGPRVSDQLSWWRTRLRDVPRLEVPTDHPRPAIESTAGARVSTRIPREVVGRLTELSNRRGMTLFMTLLAAFHTLLMRWTGQTDLAVGSPVAGRSRQELEEAVGLFVNTLVLRAELDGHQRFSDLLGQIRDVVTGALARQDVPFEKLVEDLNVERTLSHTPLTPVMFAFQNVPPALVALPGLEVEPFEIDRRTARFDLSLFVADREGGLEASVEYRTDLFEPETIRRVLGHYRNLLGACAERPDERIRDLALLDPEERARLLGAWSRPRPAASGLESVPRAVQRLASEDPRALAVVAGSSRLSYGELDRRANVLAARLRRHGVGCETRVGIFLHRSVPFVVSALAVWRAGGAYVPLDPSYPSERVRRIVSDGELTVIVTSGDLEHLLPPADGSVIVRVDDGSDDRAGVEGHESVVDVSLHPDQLAYVIFTSGSTGAPKGVGVPHRGLSNLVAWHRRAFEMTSADRVTQVASVGFDASVWEMWSCLATGGQLHILDDETRADASRFWSYVEEHAVTVAFLPTLSAELALRIAPHGGGPLRYLLTGGDRLVTWPEPSSFALVNNYGPTEGTVVSTSGVVEAVGGADRAPSIGRPIDGVRALVLDESLNPVPAGVVGELFIGGAGLARGYLGRPGTTAERFVPDPLSDNAGARLYRTGDFVRWGGGGVLQFVGRRDDQVKLRGFRIELGEVEAALSRRPGCAASAALVRGKGGDAQLVGYVSPVPGCSLDAAEIREALSETLPGYMVPSTVVVLDELPVNASGKVDRSALPEPKAVSPSAETVDPRNEVEEIVVDACRALLGLSSVSVLDNFFELGGHSLLAAQLAFRLREAFQMEISIRMIFETPILAELAEEIVERLAGAE